MKTYKIKFIGVGDCLPDNDKTNANWDEISDGINDLFEGKIYEVNFKPKKGMKIDLYTFEGFDITAFYCYGIIKQLIYCKDFIEVYFEDNLSSTL